MKTKHMPEPWRLEMGIMTASDGTLFMQQRDENTQRILACVNAMEGIADPQLLRKSWDEQMFNEVKSNYVKTMLLTKEELQKLGEQYKNQEETPYIETSQPKDAPTKSDMKELLSYMKKYEQLKEVIQNMVDRLDEHGEILLRKDSIIVLALKEAIK